MILFALNAERIAHRILDRLILYRGNSDPSLRSGFQINQRSLRSLFLRRKLRTNAFRT